MTTAYTIRAHNRRGISVTGTSHATPETIVHQAWRNRWRDLTVTAPDGELVGEVATGDDGRTFWYKLTTDPDAEGTAAI